MDFELQDVILDLLHFHSGNESRGPSRKNSTHQKGSQAGSALARVNFFRSRLIFESFSDGAKDVDLVSQEILLSDLRYVDAPKNKRANVFTTILSPMDHTRTSQGEGRGQDRGGQNPLQAEVGGYLNIYYCYFSF